MNKIIDFLKSFWNGLKRFATETWTPKWSVVNHGVIKYINVDGIRVDVTDYIEMYVSGFGVEYAGVPDGSTIYCRKFDTYNEKYEITKRPVVIIKDIEKRYWFESDVTLKKFICYVDLYPFDDETDLSDEEKQNFGLCSIDKYHDVLTWVKQYNEHKDLMTGLSEMSFVELCKDAYNKVFVIKDKKYEDCSWRWSLVAARYGLTWEYKLVPTECLKGECKYILK